MKLVLMSIIHLYVNCFSLDTSIAELIKEHTDSEEFLDSLRCQQGQRLFSIP